MADEKRLNPYWDGKGYDFSGFAPWMREENEEKGRINPDFARLAFNQGVMGSLESRLKVSERRPVVVSEDHHHFIIEDAPHGGSGKVKIELLKKDLDDLCTQSEWIRRFKKDRVLRGYELLDLSTLTDVLVALDIYGAQRPLVKRIYASLRAELDERRKLVLGTRASFREDKVKIMHYVGTKGQESDYYDRVRSGTRIRPGMEQIIKALTGWGSVGTVVSAYVCAFGCGLRYGPRPKKYTGPAVLTLAKLQKNVFMHATRTDQSGFARAARVTYSSG